MHIGANTFRRSESGMTLVEIVVSVGLLVVIVTALLGAFNQTTRAFKTGFNQTDVLESGRAALEMVARVTTELSPSGMGNLDPNAFSLHSPIQSVSHVDIPLSTNSPRQRLFMQKLLLLQKTPEKWVRSAFLVGHVDSFAYPWNSPEDVVIGSLYRYQAETSCSITNRDFLNHDQALQLLEPRDVKINAINLARYSKVIDGVVHFSVKTSHVGWEFTDSGQVTNRVGDVYERLPGFEILGRWARFIDPVTAAEEDIYVGAMLPSYVEVEIGVLENEAFGQVRALLSDKVATADFLRNNAHRIHFFRQRIPIRLGVSL